jgi:hypothetical protein
MQWPLTAWVWARWFLWAAGGLSEKCPAGILAGGREDVEYVQSARGRDDIVEQVVVVEALRPLQIRLPQLGPARDMRHDLIRRMCCHELISEEMLRGGASTTVIIGKSPAIWHLRMAISGNHREYREQ